jgi:hypothetical protein
MVATVKAKVKMPKSDTLNDLANKMNTTRLTPMRMALVTKEKNVFAIRRSVPVISFLDRRKPDDYEESISSLAYPISTMAHDGIASISSPIPRAMARLKAD